MASGPMKQPLFELRAVRKRYGGKTVLNVDHLAIPSGEVTAFVGPNGAGKSTLLRLLHFLEPCDEGEVLFDGQAVRFPPPMELRRDITMVFQRPMLLSGSVRWNVSYGTRLRGLRQDGSIDSLLQHLDLKTLEHSPARLLSGGELQRVALGRALVLRTRVLLLDEPTANLDPYNAALIERSIKELREEGHTTIVLVTHHVMQARRLADRVGLLLGGQPVEMGEADRFFDAPQDPRTRAFLQGDLVY